MQIHVPIQPEAVLAFGGLMITNTLLTSWIVLVVLVAFALIATRGMRLVPSGSQNVVEAVIELLLSLSEQTAGANARRFLPLVATLFLYILTANWIGILPGVGSIPALRSANSDLSITAAMAVIVFLWVQVTGLRTDPKAYFLKFVWPIPLLEIITEISRPVSLAFRLFGNMLAGFILVEVMLQLFPVGIPAVFLALELGVGLIQAMIFAILTLAFLSIAGAHGHAGEHRAENHPSPQPSPARGEGVSG